MRKMPGYSAGRGEVVNDQGGLTVSKCWPGPESENGSFALTSPQSGAVRATPPLPVAHVLRETKKLPLASSEILLLTK